MAVSAAMNQEIDTLIISNATLLVDNKDRRERIKKLFKQYYVSVVYADAESDQR